MVLRKRVWRSVPRGGDAPRNGGKRKPFFVTGVMASRRPEKSAAAQSRREVFARAW